MYRNIEPEFNSSIKSEKISIRVTKEQKAIIQNKANQANLSLGSYMVQVALGQPTQSSLNVSNLASHMCRFYLLLDDINDLEIRKSLRGWGEQHCRYLK